MSCGDNSALSLETSTLFSFVPTSLFILSKNNVKSITDAFYWIGQFLLSSKMIKVTA